MSETKQVIVIRRDLNMRRGKEIAQGSHASMAFLTRRLNLLDGTLYSADLTRAQREWLESSFRKIVCQVPDGEALLAVELAARAEGLEVHRVTDAGLTEFGGVPTMTAIAIGPDYDAVIDLVTGKLELY